jgi:hypothetical protein
MSQSNNNYAFVRSLCNLSFGGEEYIKQCELDTEAHSGRVGVEKYKTFAISHCYQGK